MVQLASTALLWKTLCWLPMYCAKVYLSSWHSLMDSCFPHWTDLLSHLISHNMLLSDSQLFHVSMSLPLPRIPHAQPSSTLAPNPQLIHLKNVYSFFTIIQLKDLLNKVFLTHSSFPTSWTDPAFCCVGRQHSIYSELDLISNLTFPLIGLAMQDSLFTKTKCFL